MNIAKALKEARDAKWITQEELAMRTKLTLNQIQLIEEGMLEYDYISKEELHSIAEAFGVPLEVFIILGLEDTDVAKGKEEIAKLLMPSLRNIILELIKDKED